MIVVFEFEKDLYAREGLEVEWYGHPLLDIVKPRMGRSEFLDKAGFGNSRPYIGLFPGSRLQEITEILPVMRDTIDMVHSDGLEMDCIVGGVPGIDDSVYRDIIGDDLPLMKNMTYEIMANAELNLVASGTATLECAILGKPLFVLYKTSLVTYLIARKLIKIPDIGLVNVVAGKRIVPEFVQSACNSENIARKVADFFSSGGYRDRITVDLETVRQKLGEKGASRKAAESVLRML